MKSIATLVVIAGIGLLLSAGFFAEDESRGAMQTQTPEKEKKQEGAKSDDELAMWGKPVAGAKAQLLGPSFLRVGQPLEVTLRTESLAQESPLLTLCWGDGATGKITMTDAQGRPVPVQVQDVGAIRIWPTELHAQGRYWKPGIYDIVASIEIERQPLEPEYWHGKLLSNKIRVEIAESGKPRPSALGDPEFRKLVGGWIKDLESENAATREKATESLGVFALDAIPLIEDALLKSPPRTVSQLKNIQKAAIHQFAGGRFVGYHPWQLERLEDSDWKALEKHADEWEKLVAGARRACVAPVMALSEKELIPLLTHDDPAMRILSIRSLPRTKNKEILNKLVACLNDGFAVPVGDLIHQYSSNPVASVAYDALVWQGPEVIPLVVNLAVQPAGGPWTFNPIVVGMLGKLGPHDASEKVLNRLLEFKDVWAPGDAMNAFVSWGRGGVPALMRISQDEKQAALTRQFALSHLVRLGKADELKPVLMKFLGPNVPDELAWEALKGMEKFKFRDVLPDVKRLALSEKTYDIVRQKAITAVVGMAERSEAAKILLGLIASDTESLARRHAMSTAAKNGFRELVPKLLEALEDSDFFIRDSADRALKVLANLPDGIGYDAVNPNSAVWRRWWQSKK